MDLKKILENHKKWMNNEGGERADLRYADLRCADLRCADLRYANLYDANLSDANLRYADLSDANLSCANLRNADLSGAKWNIRTAFYPLQCPEEGSFIAWKKAGGKIVKLEILADAKRSSATSRKCRCSAAKVLEIQNIDGSLADAQEVASDYDSKFVYRVGEVVSVNDFDGDRWKECAPGIHFFVTREEAVKYC